MKTPAPRIPSTSSLMLAVTVAVRATTVTPMPPASSARVKIPIRERGAAVTAAG